MSGDRPVAGRAATERTLDAARLAVIKARACLAEWAAADIDLWDQIKPAAQAAERAEPALEEALAQLPSVT